MNAVPEGQLTGGHAENMTVCPVRIGNKPAQDDAPPGAWTLTTTRSPDGMVDLTTTIATEGEPMIVVLRLNREEARAHARGVMAAA
ncbi:hypothetical protein, partial [Methylobacterium soli]|uniref:hypothetical protein n=1 Tax=Methylobacterium soli TaxID=553447 RepID=UPI001EE30889